MGGWISREIVFSAHRKEMVQQILECYIWEFDHMGAAVRARYGEALDQMP